MWSRVGVRLGDPLWDIFRGREFRPKVGQNWPTWGKRSAGNFEPKWPQSAKVSLMWAKIGLTLVTRDHVSANVSQMWPTSARLWPIVANLGRRLLNFGQIWHESAQICPKSANFGQLWPTLGQPTYLLFMCVSFCRGIQNCFHG